MQFERRALYNLLRMNWLRDQTIDAEDWQVEDYRSLKENELFERLALLGLELDRQSFHAMANEFDSPEDLVDSFVDETVEIQTHDYTYLLVFELWRRLAPEQTCLSIFCDELDHQINLYDIGKVVHPDDLQDAFANLQKVLDENLDEGGDAQEIFHGIVMGCANDIESFLYDYIAEQVDNEDYTYASDLLEGYYPYIEDRAWFDFLRARILGLTDINAANKIVRAILERALKQSDLELLLEILSFMVQGEEQKLFRKTVKAVADLVQTEDEFQELLHISADFHRCLDHDYQERAIEEILEAREDIDPEEPVPKADPHRKALMQILELSSPPRTNLQ